MTMTLRVLHVVGNMNVGGIQTWLMRVLRTIDRRRYSMDFLIRTAERGVFDDEIRALGGRIIRCPDRRRPWSFARTFTRALRDQGPYDVVHSHVGPFSGFVLQVSAYNGVPLRIAHSHNDNRVEEAGRGWPRRVYLPLAQRWIRHYACLGLAASEQAAEYLFGPSWRRYACNRLLLYGVDFAPFARPPDRVSVREELALSPDALVIGHVGRFHWQKNHDFFIDIAAEVAKRSDRARFLLVGGGDLRRQVEDKALACGIADRVVFFGPSDDVPRLMLGAMDAFLFPSRHEGLGIVLLEAQAAGLPCVLSDVVPREADVVPQLMHRLPLTAPPSTWAERVLHVATPPPTVTRERAWAALVRSDFALERSVSELARAYETAAPRDTSASLEPS